MDIVQKTDSNKLEQFAIESARSFLNGSKSRAKGFISLYGANEEILNSVKNVIYEYLKENYGEVEIKLGEVGGYSINVGYYIS